MADETKDPMREAVEGAIDRIENLLGALSLPLPDSIHMQGLRPALPEIRDDLRAALSAPAPGTRPPDRAEIRSLLLRVDEALSNACRPVQGSNNPLEAIRFDVQAAVARLSGSATGAPRDETGTLNPRINPRTGRKIHNLACPRVMGSGAECRCGLGDVDFLEADAPGAPRSEEGKERP